MDVVDHSWRSSPELDAAEARCDAGLADREAACDRLIAAFRATGESILAASRVPLP